MQSCEVFWKCKKKNAHHLIEVLLFCLLQNVPKPVIVYHLDSAFSGEECFIMLISFLFLSQQSWGVDLVFLQWRKREGDSTDSVCGWAGIWNQVAEVQVQHALRSDSQMVAKFKDMLAI